MTQLNLFDGIENKEFLEYHKTNPHLYEAFKSVAFDAMKMGFKNYGANGIFEIIRWKRAERGDGEFKINNNFAPLFARLFINEFPQHSDFFRLRKSKFNKYIESIKHTFKTFNILFTNSFGKQVGVEFTPEESDWWISYTIDDITYDIHYCEDYNEIIIYEASADVVNKVLYKSKINQDGN